MKFSKLLFPTALAGFLSVVTASAQEAHDHHHDRPEKLGKVSFPISCSSAAQEHFTRALALLHSFWYEEAEKAFAKVAETDSDCAMGYWGMAMSRYHPIWAPPDSADLKRGMIAVERATAAGGKTGREKAYIAAIEAFYKDAEKRDHRTRALAFEKAMEQVHLNYPQDDEAAIFYALALLGTAPPNDKTYVNQKQAAALLNDVLPRAPEHPGVAHYLIHSFDYPQLAPLALDAARRYAQIAPSSPHALHMPSHIFTRLGLWQESIHSNLASATAAREWVARAHPEKSSFDQLHAMDYLVYAYLQGAQDQKAQTLVDQLCAISRVDEENFAAAYAFAAIPGRYALERSRWSEAAALQVHPATFPWARFPFAESMFYFARAMGAARSGEAAAARPDVEKLAALHRGLVEAKSTYWAGQVEIQHQAAAAWLAFAEGRHEEALERLRSAAELEDSTDKHPVTPGPIVPARELLGEMLLELHRPAAALEAFAAAQQVQPSRFRSLYGAARAAELAGDREKAKKYYTQLISLCQQADSQRPEYEQARVFLAGE